MFRYLCLSLAFLGFAENNSEASVLVFRNSQGEETAIGADPEFRDGFQMYQCVSKDRTQPLPRSVYMKAYRDNPGVSCQPMTKAPVRFLDTLNGVLQGSKDWDLVKEDPGRFAALMKEIETGRDMGIFPRSPLDPNFIEVNLRVGGTTDQMRIPVTGSVENAVRAVLEARRLYLSQVDPQSQMVVGDLLHVVYQGAVARPLVGETRTLGYFFANAEMLGQFAKWTESQKANHADCMSLLREYAFHLGAVDSFLSFQYGRGRNLQGFIWGSNDNRQAKLWEDLVEIGSDGNACFRTLARVQTELQASIDTESASLKAEGGAGVGIANQQLDLSRRLSARVKSHVVVEAGK